MPSGSAYSDILQERAQRTIGSSIKRRLAMNKYEWDKDMVGVRSRIGRRTAAGVIAASMKRGLAQRSMGIAVVINRMATTLPTLE